MPNCDESLGRNCAKGGDEGLHFLAMLRVVDAGTNFPSQRMDGPAFLRIIEAYRIYLVLFGVQNRIYTLIWQPCIGSFISVWLWCMHEQATGGRRCPQALHGFPKSPATSLWYASLSIQDAGG
jgi:hypothetical protein